MLRLIPRIKEEANEALLSAGIERHVARVLHARGVTTPEQAEAFLHPSLDALFDPFLLFSMEAAVNRIHAAIEKGESICIYGDYDVDGICAVSILKEALLSAGANVSYYIPSRHQEGYGLNIEAIQRIAAQASLLITVDCGITSVAEAQQAKALGLDLIITDHHEPPETLPDALAVVDPLLGEYPFRRLCGAGVAFKVAQALFGFENVAHLLDLAALATVADLVPLLEENRILVHHGLLLMQETERVGLRALFDVAGILGKKITAGHLGFQVAPRLNAGGRLSDASRGVALLTTNDEALARDIAAELHAENLTRQRMEQELLAEAVKWVQENVDFLRDKALVVVGQEWNPGVVGLVASRLTERFGWPAIVLSQNGDSLTGSARSIVGVNIHAALLQCEDLFTRFGGHAQAAGLTMPSENLEAFRQRLNEAIERVEEPRAYLPQAQYDLDMELFDVTIPLIERLSMLAPFGFGNPSPVFRLSGARVLEARGVGAEGKHLKLTLAQENISIAGIAFSQGAMLGRLPETIDALFSPSINEYMGKRAAQCEISRIVPSEALQSFRRAVKERADDFDMALLSGNFQPAPERDVEIEKALVREALQNHFQGTLLTVRTLEGALFWLSWLEAEGLSGEITYCFSRPEDPRGFNTLCAMPEKGIEQGFSRVFALDDGQAMRALADLLPTDEALRGLYRVLRAGDGRFLSEAALAGAAGMRPATVRLGLQAFEELELVAYRPVPFRAALLPPKKCDLADSKSLKRARKLAWGVDV